MKYHYKEICCGEIVSSKTFSTKQELLNEIRNNSYLYSDFEVIYGDDITDYIKRSCFYDL